MPSTPDLHARLRRLLGAVLLPALLLAPLAIQAAEWPAAELFKLLAQQKSGRASYIEKKYIGILDKPVESSGTLAFTAPDKLEKRTLKPRPELLRLEGDKLYIEQAGKAPLNLNLSSYPEVAAFVDSIRATLAGDRKALENSYQLNLLGAADKWQLILLPKYTSMSAILTRIAISGRQGEVQRIEFALADGDHSEMLISKVGP
ncbi:MULTISPECIES: LolA-related protein [unclassified Uliginosibacterium]|uniref:LolA-related protein n=1 Tax=unclassified Uliginosibacterium TaxID=2621521 RepID=UPI000C7D51B7|nr:MULTISPECIES: LolA-related protein [unclassified Uliginosibacterium]MDO6387578.1 outer membrane lipoprotein carrier protein LolA [Uliginosibacterium sp. 31-12]PLK47901.1 acyltransferase [Uliginosibacterium sp. TH139]